MADWIKIDTKKWKIPLFEITTSMDRLKSKTEQEEEN